MPRVNDRKDGVVLLDTREHTPDHERAVHRALAQRLAHLLGTELAATPQDLANPYYLLTETLVQPCAEPALSIQSEADFFGGKVSHPYMATKAISHPLPANARFPLGWTDDFAVQASDALLRGYTVFGFDDAVAAAALLLRDGPLRLKPVRATAGRGQSVIESAGQLEQALMALDEQEVGIWGLVLEENLEQVETFSVGQALVAGITCSYYGTQQLTHDHDGETVYGGSDLIVVRGGYDALLQLDMEDPLRLAVTQARQYEAAAFACFPGFVASRRNYDVARGVSADGRLRSGVLEQSWRIGGASSAELLALQAFAEDPALQRIRASTHEVFGAVELPPDATVFYQGDDRELGQLCKYARLRSYDHP